MPSPTYISREDLSAFILQPIESRPAMAIIDVRDDDHVGGHIYTSTHVPSSSLDYKLPELVRKLKSKEIVVFHCALSQVRGPTAARRYVRERARLLSVERDTSREVSSEEEKNGVVERDASREVSSEVEKNKAVQEGETGDLAAAKQKIFILDGGFVKWQEK